MANTDYQSQLTQIYDRLFDISVSMGNLAQSTTVNTIQVSLSASLNTIATNLDALNTQVTQLNMMLTDILAQLTAMGG